MENLKHIATRAVIILSALFLLWFAASWAEVVTKNTTQNPVYSEYNIFKAAMPENLTAK